AGPAKTAGVATTEPAEVPQAGGTSSGEGEAPDTKPGEETFSASGKASPGFPIPPDKCDHKTSAGRWVKWRPLDYDDPKSPWVCPKCGTPKLVAMESGGPYS